MNSQISNNPSISERLTAFVAALLEHLLALSSLASWEAARGAKQILVCLLLFVVTLALGFVGYILLLALLILTATSLCQVSLLLTLSLLALVHFLFVGILIFVIYHKRPTSFLELTRHELVRDIEALSRN